MFARLKQSVRQSLERVPGPCALAHIDCNLYQSTADVLRGLRHRLVPGTVLVFDEFLNYPGWEHGEYAAWNEFVTAEAVRFRYLAFTPSQQVAIRILP
jgi:hypothetical protein